jgi:hypothetical protein
LGKPLIEVETNLKQFGEPYVRWNMYVGSALASVGLLLSPRLRRVYIPSTGSYADLSPDGSHPLLDPLWSTESVTFVHDGGEATRVEKVMALARNEVALQYLRVCWENRDGKYNCGRCEKCLRTMVSLTIADALEECATFDGPIDVDAVAALRLPNQHTRAFFAENLAALAASGKHARLARALRTLLTQPAADQWPTQNAAARRRRRTGLWSWWKGGRSRHG